MVVNKDVKMNRARILTIIASLGLAFIIGEAYGEQSAKHKIAEAIRSGRLTVQQRVDSIADQIEDDRYIGVGEQ